MERTGKGGPPFITTLESYMWWRLVVEITVALFAMLVISVALVAGIMLLVTAQYADAVVALVFVALGCGLSVRLAPQMDNWVARHHTKSSLSERLQVIVFGAVCLLLGTWLSYVVFDGASEGKMNLLSKRPVFSQIVLDAHKQPLAFWFNVAYGLFLILILLYGSIWCIRKWRQLSNPTVERGARKNGARPSR